MRTIFAAALLTFTLPFAAIADPGALGVFADQDLTCYYDEQVGVVKDFWIMHVNTDGADASRFKVVTSTGFTGILLQHQSDLIITGIVTEGVIACYGACRQGQIVVMRLTFFIMGGSAICSQIELKANPNFPNANDLPEMRDCSGNVWQTSSVPLLINSDFQTCSCLVAQSSSDGEPRAGTSNGFEFCDTVPVEPSTWGGIKALFE